MAPGILRFDAARTEPEAGAPAEGRVLAGDPRFTTWNHYTDPTGRFFSGVWAATEGSWRIEYAPNEQEFCVLLEGEAVLDSESGESTVLRAGDAFVIPGGFRGTWTNRSPVRKHYAIALM